MAVSARRLPENPIIAPADLAPLNPDWEVVCTFNAGAVTYRDETLLLVRVAERPRPSTPQAAGMLLQRTGIKPATDHVQVDSLPGDFIAVPLLDVSGGTPRVVARYVRADTPDLDTSDPRMIKHGRETYLTSISHIRLARSFDGIHFVVGKDAVIWATDPLEEFGVEDPRITEIDGEYYVNYTAVSRHGIATALAVTSDFETFEKRGIIFCPENRDVAIFPEKVRGRYAALHRPVPNVIGAPAVWLAFSNNLIDWGDHRFVLGSMPGAWDGNRIGGGAPPIRTEHGWLEVYHGVDALGRYALGAALLDLDEPWRVLGRSPEPLLRPEAPYENEGFFANVVFSCGCVLDGDRLRVYYGAADLVTAAADFRLSEILTSLESTATAGARPWL